MWLRDILRIRKLRRDHDRLYALCGKLEQQLSKANRGMDALLEYNSVFRKCLRRAKVLWKEAHPESRMWPDGAKNIVWLLDRLERYEQGLRKAVDALGAVHVQYLGQVCPAWRTHIPTDLLELYNDTHRKSKSC